MRVADLTAIAALRSLTTVAVLGLLCAASGCDEKTDPPPAAPKTAEPAAPSGAGAGGAALGTAGEVAKTLQPSTAKTPPPAAVDSPPTAEPQVAKAQARPALAANAGLAMVPKTALAVGVVQDLGTVLDTLGRQAIGEAIGGAYEMAVAGVIGFTGHNLLDPKNWPEIGIPANPSGGAAWLDFEKETGLLWLDLEDADKFRTFLYKLASKADVELAVLTEGDAILIHAKRDEEVTLLLKGKVLMVAMTDRRDRYALEAARLAAVQGESDSILARDSFKQAQQKVNSGQHIGLWSSLTGMHGLVQHDLVPRGESASETTALEAPHKAAVAEGLVDPPSTPGSTPGVVAKPVDPPDEEDEWEARWRKRQQAELEMYNTYIAPTEWIAAGLTITRRGVEGRAVVQHRPGAALLAMMKVTKGLPPVVKATTDVPAYLAAGTVDPAGLQKFLTAVAATEYSDMAALDAMWREHLGISPLEDIFPNMTGELGLSISADIAALASAEDPQIAARKIDGAIVVGVQDTAVLAGLFSKISASRQGSRMMRQDAETGGLLMGIPEWRDVRLAAKAGSFVAATTKAIIDGTASDGAASFAHKTDLHPGLKTLLGRTGQSGIAIGSMSTAAAFFLIGESSAPSRAERAHSAESPAYLAKRAEVEKARELMWELERKSEAAQQRLVMDAVSGLGISGISAAVAGNDLVMHGGQFLQAADWGTLAASIASAVAAIEGRDRSAVHDARTRLWKLQDELEALAGGDDVARDEGPGGIIEVSPPAKVEMPAVVTNCKQACQKIAALLVAEMGSSMKQSAVDSLMTQCIPDCDKGQFADMACVQGAKDLAGLEKCVVKKGGK